MPCNQYNLLNYHQEKKVANNSVCFWHRDNKINSCQPIAAFKPR